jgi:DNA-binding transcriptional regulator/RsmH inhibitor MraZ
VPPVLREKAGIDGEVVVNGSLDQLQIWNRERFEKRLEEQPFTEEDFRALTEKGV